MQNEIEILGSSNSGRHFLGVPLYAGERLSQPPSVEMDLGHRFVHRSSRVVWPVSNEWSISQWDFKTHWRLGAWSRSTFHSRSLAASARSDPRYLRIETGAAVGGPLAIVNALQRNLMTLWRDIGVTRDS
jgi:hypothetical protein